MPAEILAIGTTSADSSDVVVAAGEQLVVGLKGSAGPAVGYGASVLVQLKTDAGTYFTIDALGGGRPALVLAGAGTYRFSRVAGTSCGVFSA